MKNNLARFRARWGGLQPVACLAIILGTASVSAAQAAVSALPLPQTPVKSASSDGGWPREYQAGQLTFTIYQSQVESWD